ncbi:MAG: NrfD/PsrC family molybdoenzyme membrane anchor subunit [Gordonibacter sp.]|uniref:NrfD/PsrC family molybdoenzyme membrane anchor subunit n=1 Tax=Gordonibacter sp. TaxID=1968902 RepID=UPI002FCC4A76
MTESTTPKRPSNALWLGVFGALALVGIVSFIMQLTQGLQVANLGNDITWGLYIVGFLVFTGVAAGCLLFASAPFMFSNLAAYRPYARVASFTAVACGCVCAGLFIISDTGNPLRAFSILTSFQFASPLFWDTVILIAYVVLGIVFTLMLVKVAKGEKTEESVRPLAIAVFVAALLVTVTALAFALQVARPTWNNPGLVLSFFAAAVVAGGSLLTIVYTVLDRSGYLPMDEQVSRGFSRVVALFLVAELVFVLAEVFSGLYIGIGEEATVAAWLVSGPGALFFWVELACFAGGIALLLQKAPALRVAGAALAFVAVFLVKYNMLQAQLHNPLIGFAGPVAAPGAPAGAYFPGLIEWGVAMGIVGIGLFILTLGLSKLKLGK